MRDPIERKIRDWNDETARETNLRIQYLEKRLYRKYEPSMPPNNGFWRRLSEWLDNISNGDEQKILFNSIPRLFYIGEEEFKELYRIAYDRVVSHWLIERLSLNLDDDDLVNKLNGAVNGTWFCPISDSLKINSFYHINHITSGWDYRPDWRSLDRFGDLDKIREYCKANQELKYLVLLEDFVGGGSQMRSAIEYASKLCDLVDVLVVPLVICPKGAGRISAMENDYGVKITPVLELDSEAFISEYPKYSDDQIINDLRQIAVSTYKQVSDGHAPYEVDADGNPLKPYHPLGWDKTGGLVVMFTNTPDNTLPLFHWESKQWKPLFPRHSRV